MSTFRYASILSVLQDEPLGVAADCLSLTARTDEQGMADHIRVEREEARARKLAKAA